MLMVRVLWGCAETRDHVPSRVLLDSPYPDNLPVVGACRRCNASFAADEEYVACLIDSIVAGSGLPSRAHRPSVLRTLSQRPALAARLESARSELQGVPRFTVEDERVRNVVLKLARGHVLFELNDPQREEPSSIGYAPLCQLEAPTRDEFERIPLYGPSPEVGSRAMQRMLMSEDFAAEWIVVQPGRYRYLAFVGSTVLVRVVLSEYLACEVVWERC